MNVHTIGLTNVLCFILKLLIRNLDTHVYVSWLFPFCNVAQITCIERTSGNTVGDLVSARNVFEMRKNKCRLVATRVT